jgi:hypothetical protein
MHLLAANAIFEFALSFENEDLDASLSERSGERGSRKTTSDNNNAAAHCAPPPSMSSLHLR